LTTGIRRWVLATGREPNVNEVRMIDYGDGAGFDLAGQEDLPSG
jgi:hypothetical protein